MEPDEAVDALRDLLDEERADLLGRMPADAPRLAGGARLPRGPGRGFHDHRFLVPANVGDGAAQVADRLAESHEHRLDIDAVAVVDDGGRADRRPPSARPHAGPARRSGRSHRAIWSGEPNRSR